MHKIFDEIFFLLSQKIEELNRKRKEEEEEERKLEQVNEMMTILNYGSSLHLFIVDMAFIMTSRKDRFIERKV